MRDNGPLRKVVSAALALLVAAVSTGAQASAPVANLAEAYAMTDSKGRTVGVHTEFEVKSNVVVSNLSIFYRVQPNMKYQSIELKQGLDLRYAGNLPSAENIEYYLLLTPENGASLNLIGTPSAPSLIATSDLTTKPGKRTWEPHNKIIAVIVGVLVLVVIGVVVRGRANPSK